MTYTKKETKFETTVKAQRHHEVNKRKNVLNPED
jgi:hypothetical protein